jgi:2-amino-4-hydroxy-6-hydroxymethyldihydropteridine diphosphokinase
LVLVTKVYLALGSNIGNREANMRAAVRALRDISDVRAVSSLYRSPAVVLEDDEPGPDFLNAACEIASTLDPPALLREIKRIEHALGRRPAARWAPRAIDIDILLYGEEVVEAPDLTIPHPRMAERDFVLVPLAEIAPGAIHPALHRRVEDLAAAVDPHLERAAGPEWAI